MKLFFIAVALLIALQFTSTHAVAQGVGYDMVSQEMKDNGLFHPHMNNCSASEAFVPVGAGGTSGATGFCIEKSERSGSALSWDACRQICAGLGKRLPEPIEFKTACNLAGSIGLNNMTDNWEWATNFAYFHAGYLTSIGNYQHMEIVLAGNGGCFYSGAGEASDDQGAQNTGFAFRCVH